MLKKDHFERGLWDEYQNIQEFFYRHDGHVYRFASRAVITFVAVSVLLAGLFWHASGISSHVHAHLGNSF